jgi:hypothetical protein
MKMFLVASNLCEIPQISFKSQVQSQDVFFVSKSLSDSIFDCIITLL